nr:P-loop NTPase fold protein [Clostridium sp.]
MKKLIIIDDLERSELPPNVILGYLSNLIIEQGIRVILVANEDEYIKNNSKNEKNYLKVREKLIAYRFELKPNLDEAIKSFLNDIDLKESKYFDIARDVVKKLDIKNMRIIRQAIINYNYILMKISKELLKEYEDYMYKVFEINLVLFTQFASGELDIKDKEIIYKVISCYYKYNISLNKYNEDNKDKEKDIWAFMYFGKIPLIDSWEDIIINGIFDNNLIDRNIKDDNVATIEGEKDNVYFILNNFYSLAPSRLKEVISTVEREFELGKYVDIGDILHIYNLWSLFAREGVINRDKQALDEWFNKIINKNKNLLSGYKKDLWSGYNGFAYDETEEFNQLKNRLINIAEENHKLMVRQKLEKEINTDFNLKTFIDNLNLDNSNSEESLKYYDMPILDMILIDELFNKLIEDTLENQDLFIYALKKRYGVIYANGTLSKKYVSEFEAVKKIYKQYNDYLNNTSSLYNTKVIRYRYFIQEYKEIIDYMKTQIDEILVSSNAYS